MKRQHWVQNETSLRLSDLVAQIHIGLTYRHLQKRTTIKAIAKIKSPAATDPTAMPAFSPVVSFLFEDIGT
jgi:hypothetical protein